MRHVRIPWRWSFRRLLLGGWLLIAGFMVVWAYSAGITVPDTRVDEDYFVPDPNQMKPDACGGITITNLIVASGDTLGTAANDLILGTQAGERIAGRQGHDCILGGEGAVIPSLPFPLPFSIGDILCGDEGNDVLIGGPSGDDLCIGGPGSDTMISCGYSFQEGVIVLGIDITPLLCP